MVSVNVEVTVDVQAPMEGVSAPVSVQAMPACPRQIIEAVSHYGDCRADGVDSGVALARVIVLVRQMLHQQEMLTDEQELAQQFAEQVLEAVAEGKRMVGDVFEPVSWRLAQKMSKHALERLRNSKNSQVRVGSGE